MSFKEFKSRVQGKVSRGLIICLCEPINECESKILAITVDQKYHVIGICNHEKEDVVLYNSETFPDHNKTQALQKFMQLV